MSKDKLIELTNAITSAKQEVVSQGLDLVQAMFDDYFSKYPDIKEIRWRQYTPSWNDGDVCEFWLGDFAAVTQQTLSKIQSGKLDQNELFWDPQEHSFEGLDSHSQRNDMIEELREIYDLLDTEHLALLVWGDGYSITARPGSFNTEEYYDEY